MLLIPCSQRPHIRPRPHSHYQSSTPPHSSTHPSPHSSLFALTLPSLLTLHSLLLTLTLTFTLTFTFPLTPHSTLLPRTLSNYFPHYWPPSLPPSFCSHASAPSSRHTAQPHALSLSLLTPHSSSHLCSLTLLFRLFNARPTHTCAVTHSHFLPHSAHTPRLHLPDTQPSHPRSPPLGFTSPTNSRACFLFSTIMSFHYSSLCSSLPAGARCHPLVIH